MFKRQPKRLSAKVSVAVSRCGFLAYVSVDISYSFYRAIQRSWFARVNALCNLSRKKSREVAVHFRADF